MGEIPGALAKTAILVHAHPVFAAVVGTVEPAFLGFNHGVDAVGVRARNRDADAAHDPRRETVSFQPRPGAAAVGGFEKTAAGTAAVQAPGRAVDLPQGGKQRVGITGIENHVDGAGLVVLIEHFLPGGAAVGGAKDAALFVETVGVAKRGHKDDVRVFRIHDHRADVPRVFQPDVFPGLSTVERLVYPIAVGDVAANAGLTAAGVDDVVVRRRHGDTADRGDVFFVENGLPIRPGVGGSPDAARGRAEIEDGGLSRNTSHGQGAPTAERADLAPAHRAEQTLRDASRRRGSLRLWCWRRFRMFFCLGEGKRSKKDKHEKTNFPVDHGNGFSQSGTSY